VLLVAPESPGRRKAQAQAREPSARPADDEQQQDGGRQGPTPGRAVGDGTHDGTGLAVPEQRGSAAGPDHHDGRDQRQAGQHGDEQPTASGLPAAGHGPGDGLADDGERQDVRRTRHGAGPAGTSGREGAGNGDQEQQLQDPDEVDRGEHQAAEELGTGAYREGDQLVGRDDLVTAAGSERGDDGEHTEAQEGLRGKLADGRQRRGRQRA